MAAIDSQAVSGKSMTKKGNQTDRAIKKLRGTFKHFFYSCWRVLLRGYSDLSL